MVRAAGRPWHALVKHPARLALLYRKPRPASRFPHTPRQPARPPPSSRQRERSPRLPHHRIAARLSTLPPGTYARHTASTGQVPVSGRGRHEIRLIGAVSERESAYREAMHIWMICPPQPTHAHAEYRAFASSHIYALTWMPSATAAPCRIWRRPGSDIDCAIEPVADADQIDADQKQLDDMHRAVLG